MSNYFKDVGLTYRSESNTFIDCIGHTDRLKGRIPLNEIDMVAHKNRLHMIHKDQIIDPCHDIECQTFHNSGIALKN